MIFLVSGVKTIKLEIPRHTKTVCGAVKQATKSAHDARFTGPRQTGCAASDVTPMYGVTPA